MSPQFDFSFDKRVADRYNRQRAHPPAVAAKIGQAIAAAVGASDNSQRHVLEIGVGTGRIAYPVAAAGCSVVGFDLSSDMLTRSESHLRLDLLQADMHALPLANDQFDGALAVHVLHLATDWQQVLRETARVLLPGAPFIRGEDWVDPASVFARLRDELRRLAMTRFPNSKPPAANADYEQYLRSLGGAEPVRHIAAEWTVPLSPAERLSQYEKRMDNESWFLPQPVFDELFAELQAFAAATWSDLDQPLPVTRRFILTLTHGDW